MLNRSFNLSYTIYNTDTRGIYSSFHSFIYPFIHLFILSFIYSSFHSPIHPFIHLFILSIIHSSSNPWILSFFYSFFHPIILPSIHLIHPPFLLSFTYPYIHSSFHYKHRNMRVLNSASFSSTICLWLFKVTHKGWNAERWSTGYTSWSTGAPSSMPRGGPQGTLLGVLE